MTTTTLTGHDAIEYAERHGLTLSKYNDPTELARDELSLDEAREIAAEDPSLIYLEVGSLTTDTLHGTTVVRDPEGGVWWPSDEAQDEIAAAADPQAKAVEICEREPMRGEWRQ